MEAEKFSCSLAAKTDLQVSKMAMIVLIAVSIPTVVARDPTNITRSVGETDVFIPCPFEFQPSPPVWRIGGFDFTSSTLPSIFTLDPGGIYINNVTACLNGLTFQCIDTSGAGLLGRESLTGTLTVQPPGQVCGDFQELIDFNAIELNHQGLKFDNGSIVLNWKIFPLASNINCTTSRIFAYPQCQADTVLYDVQTEDVNITLPTEMSGLPLVFDISSLSMSNINQATMCPKLLDTVSFTVTEVETVNLLLGNNNNCTRVEISCTGSTHAAFANPNTSQPDIVCPIFTLDDSRCFYVNECAQFNTVTSESNPPFFRVCSEDINRCYMYFQNITEELNGLKLDIFDTISAAAQLQTCLERGRRPTRRYFKSLALEVTSASADIEITPQGQVCFYSLLQTCNLTRSVQYNVSIIDNAGNPVFKNDTLPEGYCIAIGKPQCGPFTVSAQPYTFDDYIIYNPVNKEITLIEFQVRTSWVDSSRSVISVNYSCSSVYLSAQEVAIRVGDVTVNVQCGDGVTYINNANCGADIAVCGYLIQSATPNSFDCPLNCSYLEAPNCPTNVIKIVVPIVVILLLFIVIGVLIGIVIYRKWTKVKDLLRKALGNHQPQRRMHAGEQRAEFQSRNEGFEVDLGPDQPVTINENGGT